MGIQVFNTDGTFTYPADITHVVILAWGGGGGGGDETGGGGEGGERVYNEYYYTGDPGDSFTVTIGAGGAHESNGGDTTVDTGIDTITARGGYGATDFHGAASGRLSYDGGEGGDGGVQSGGGGGAGGGPSGHDAYPDFTGFDGQGGTATLGQHGGDGGDGGFRLFDDGGADGGDGHVPGGAGGGGSDGFIGGSGAHGRVIFIWGDGTGMTQMSSGCCCDPCDLTKGQFPTAVTLTVDFTAADPPDFDPQHYDIDDPVVNTVTHHHPDACTYDTADDTFPEAPGGAHDAAVIDQAMIDLLNDNNAFELEMTEFSSGYSGIGTPSWYCSATYKCPLIGDTFFPDNGIDRGCVVGPHPDPSATSPSEHFCQFRGTGASEDYPDCGGCEAGQTTHYASFTRGDVYAVCQVDFTIFLSTGDSKFYFSISGRVNSVIWKEAIRQVYEAWLSPSDDTVTSLGGCDIQFGHDDLAFAGASGGPYETAAEALAAAQTAVSSMATGYPASGNYYDGLDGLLNGPGPPSFSSRQYETPIDCTCCPPLPNCFQPNGDAGFDVEWHHTQQHFFYADPVNVTISWD